MMFLPAADQMRDRSQDGQRNSLIEAICDAADKGYYYVVIQYKSISSYSPTLLNELGRAGYSVRPVSHHLRIDWQNTKSG